VQRGRIFVFASQRRPSIAVPDLRQFGVGNLFGQFALMMACVYLFYSKSAFFYDKGQPRGISYEALRELETIVNKKFKTGSRPVQVTFLPTSPEDLDRALEEGRGDLIATGIIVTPERQQRVDFTSPFATDVKQVIVTGANAPNLKSLDDLGGQQVLASPLTVNYATLKRLSESFV
jgi:ABC-type amino acid transport substrate-binding protein